MYDSYCRQSEMRGDEIRGSILVHKIHERDGREGMHKYKQ